MKTKELPRSSSSEYLEARPLLSAGHAAPPHASLIAGTGVQLLIHAKAAPSTTAATGGQDGPDGGPDGENVDGGPDGGPADTTDTGTENAGESTTTESDTSDSTSQATP